MNDKQLRIKIGPDVHKDFQIFLGEEDVTDKIAVESLSMDANANKGSLKVTMVVYADNIEIIPDDTTIRVVEWPPHLSWWAYFKAKVLRI